MLTVFDYTDRFTLKCTIHPFIYSIKLKLEFIVLNQLQTLVKRGLAPGLSLGSNIAPSDTSSEPPHGKEKPIPIFERDFITKTGIVSPSASLTTDSSDEIAKEHKRVDSNKTLLDSGESDLKDVMGQPDEERFVSRADDIERLYLGRWNGQELA